MKQLTKSELSQMFSRIAALNVVGLPTQKSLSLIKLHRRVKEVVVEANAFQQEMMAKYDVKLINGFQFDTKCANYAEFNAINTAALSETVDLTDYCILTESEAMIAVSKIDAPLIEIDNLVQLLTAEPSTSAEPAGSDN